MPTFPYQPGFEHIVPDSYRCSDGCNSHRFEVIKSFSSYTTIHGGRRYRSCPDRKPNDNPKLCLENWMLSNHLFYDAFPISVNRCINGYRNRTYIKNIQKTLDNNFSLEKAKTPEHTRIALSEGICLCNSLFKCLREQGRFIDCFMVDRRIGRLELVISNEYCDYDFDTVLIESINQSVPNSVIEAFERHTWFSQHCLSEIFVFNIPVEEKDTYAICVAGVAGDGYDNSCHFVEIFEESGEFIIAASLGEGEISWLNRCLDGDDFVVSAPKWMKAKNSASDERKMWSEAMAIRVEKDENITRLIMC